ncbi:periodic tryptophan protein 2 homolog [Daktulosphaira vitifoliae]|uniref:periodic tryptophan protein 2 homolog n=1 Tax=Daktulosphaira vitifoliae TaxID=58002 RepID=UPI0021AA460C|nr:periodic tryptophan protein 2 homolog [Daktulosphaira vitifoliae]
MRFNYKFSNVLGTVYRKGNLSFTPDGNSVISPVGNRISKYDLKNNLSSTLPVESSHNYEQIAISPDGTLLFAVNEIGEADLISLISNRVIHKYRFNDRILHLKFSPNGKHIAACKLNKVFILQTPGHFLGQFNQFALERVFSDILGDTTYTAWTDDSNIFAVGSKDATVRLYTIENYSNFRPYSLTGHTDAIISLFFEQNSLDLMTLSRNGHLTLWQSSFQLDQLSSEVKSDSKKLKLNEDENEEDDIDMSKGEDQERFVNDKEEKIKKKTKFGNNVELISYKKLSRHFLNDHLKEDHSNLKMTAADYHKKIKILISGFSNGSFLIFETVGMSLIHSLNISDTSISTIVLNESGDWVALGCEGHGQLLVWEWQSETYVMKQQAHGSEISCLAYSSDSMYIATGGEDGKVKLWNTQSGFCIVTFSEHTSSITNIVFAPNKKFIISASLDGTVRAFDLTRYRNFRTFVSPRPVQFASLAIDSNGEFVAAGGQDVFEAYLWSMKIGRLLEVLTGHEGPIVSLAFSPNISCTTLVSVSWDKTLRIWNAVENASDHETIQLFADGLCVAFRPDGKEVVVATLDGQLLFFDVRTSTQVGSIEGRNDLGSGRCDTDLITAKKSLQAKAFNSVCYSADGQFVIAGGQSKNVCIYNVSEAILLKKFVITQNQSFDAVTDVINRRKMTEFGNKDLIEERETREGGNVKLKLPGVHKGDLAARTFKPEINVLDVKFSPTGLSWAAATTEGVLIYSLDSEFIFDPFQLEIGITPLTTKKTLSEKEYATALMMALRLNEPELITDVIESTPFKDIDLTVISLPRLYAEKILKHIAILSGTTKHLEFYVHWIKSLLNSHQPHQTTVLMLQKNLTKRYTDLSKVCDFNKYTYTVVKRIAHLQTVEAKDEIKDEILPMDIDEVASNTEFVDLKN